MVAAAPAAPHTAGANQGARAERRFFSIYLSVVALVILAGFVPSFFLRGLIATPLPLPPLRPVLLIHGVIGTAFVLFLPFQAWLISSGRRKLHMRTGSYGFVLGAAMIAMLYLVAISNYRLTLSGGFAGVDPQLAPFAGGSVLVAIPGLLLLLFLAWRLRFSAAAHKRLIVAVSWSAAVPGLGRLLGWLAVPASPMTGIVVLLMFVGPLWAWDIASRRRPHWATAAGTIVLIGPLIVRPIILGLPGWPAIIAAMPGFG